MIWRRFALLGLLILSSCAIKKGDSPAPTAVSLPPSAAGVGKISFLKDQAFLIHYKNICLLLNPTSPALSSLKEFPYLDYLLLSENKEVDFSEDVQGRLRKDLKIISPPADVRSILSKGFTQVKGLSAGQRVLLKKEKNFIFVSAVANSRGNNGYLLEFDNGRNLFVTGPNWEAGALREFVYSLRDDGRDLFLAFIYDPVSAEALGDAVGLLQPETAVIVGPKNERDGRVNEMELREVIKNQIFSGKLVFSKDEDQFAF